MKHKIALILCLDQNKENKYEYECLHAIYSWRNCKHSLSDIDIIIYINKNTNISNSTINKIKSYKNIKIQYYDFKCSYMCLNTLYCQYLFEINETNYDYGIYIDLDLYLLHSIPNNLLYQHKSIFCYYNQYKTLLNTCGYNADKYRRIQCLNSNIYEFNTHFIINNRKNKIFSQLINLVNSPQYNNYFTKYILYNNDSYYYEEGLYDYAYLTGIINKYNCRFISDYYISSNMYKSPIFMHKHIKSFNEYINLYKK